MDVKKVKQKLREMNDFLQSDETECDEDCENCPFWSNTDEGDFCGIGTIVNDITDMKFIKEEM